MTSFSEHVCKKYINLKYFFFFYFEQQRQRCQTLLLKYLISWILNCSFLEAKTSLLSISTQNRVVQTLQLNNTCCMSERNLDVRVCFASSMVHKLCWREIPLSFKIKKKKKKTLQSLWYKGMSRRLIFMQNGKADGKGVICGIASGKKRHCENIWRRFL